MATEQGSSSAGGAEVSQKASKSNPWDPLKSPDWDEQEYTATALIRIKRLKTDCVSKYLPCLSLSVFTFLLGLSVET